jgi:hypothetical protein
VNSPASLQQLKIAPGRPLTSDEIREAWQWYDRIRRDPFLRGRSISDDGNGIDEDEEG